MITIRRICAFIVCFVSLQSVVAAVNALISSFIRQIAQADAAPYLGWLTFQMVIIPIGAALGGAWDQIAAVMCAGQ